MKKSNTMDLGSKGLPKGKSKLPKGLAGKRAPFGGGGASKVMSTTKNAKYGKGC
jgi:hypothetical protein